MQLRNVPIHDLKPHPKNPRVHPESAINKLVTSIKEYGWTSPVLVSKDGFLLAGHARVKAATRAGIETVPAIYLDLEGDKALAYLVADNRLQDETDWDIPMMKDIIEDLMANQYDVTFTGLDAAEINELFSSVHDRDIVEDDIHLEEEVESIQEPVTQLGDIWELGSHRLICGDATDPECYIRLMGEEKADLCITDPPYNVDYEGKTEDALKIKNDKMSGDKFHQFLVDSYTCIYENLADGAGIYVFHADTEGLNFRSAFCKVGFHLANVCVWVKQSLVLGRSDYQWKHEPILYGWKPTGKHRWCSDRKQTTVWEFNRPTKNIDHPTMKPIALCAYPIKNSTREKDIVIDPFGGSGSTILACEQLNRRCRTIELDEQYCDVIVKRFARVKGKEVTLIRNGKQTEHQLF